MKQTQKLKNTGSLVNYCMGNNNTIPKVGEGATMLHYSDRTACEVISVSEDGKTIVLESYSAKRVDGNGMSDDQQYKYTLTGNQFTIVYRNGAWRREYVEVWFTDAAINNAVLQEQCIDPRTGERKVVKGLTFLKKSYPKISIVFGERRAYYDYTF